MTKEINKNPEWVQGQHPGDRYLRKERRTIIDDPIKEALHFLGAGATHLGQEAISHLPKPLRRFGKT